ncbi:MAG: hypothetical protein ACRD9R_17375 [Pyrinomonadaceae bacterium]
MLFIESRVSEHQLDDAARLRLLDEVQAQGLIPLIRSTRLNCYEQALLAADQAGGLERALLADPESNALPLRGDLFCFEDYVFTLIFGGTGDEMAAEGVRVGIIYEARTREPLRKLDSFCQRVADAILSLQRRPEIGQRPPDATAPGLVPWRPASVPGQAAFTRYVARQDGDALYLTRRRETVAERVRASALLEDDGTREFLRRAHEAHAEGCSVKLLPGEKPDAPGVPLDELLDAGLVRREVFVSCRQTGHVLFRLPTPDALTAVTVSQASCGECGAAVADEKIEEMLAPTALAGALLADSSWLVNRLHAVLRQLGLPESEIATGTAAGDGTAHLMAGVCGEPFLFVLRDGSLSPTFARRVGELAVETEASHVVVITTEPARNEGRVRLFEHARRRARAGREVELIVLENVGAAHAELRAAFERVSHRALADHLCVLDASLGLSVSRLLVNRVRLLRQQGGEREFVRTPDPALPAANRQDGQPGNNQHHDSSAPANASAVDDFGEQPQVHWFMPDAHQPQE